MHNIFTSFVPLLVIILSPINTLSSPIPTPSSPCQSAHDSSSNTFQITNFLTFQSDPSSTSTTPTHTLSFTLLDPQTGASASCSRSIAAAAAADTAAGATTLDDPSHYQVCDSPSLGFVWDGTRLTVSETWSCGGVIGILVGHLDFLLSCFTMTSSYANGGGVLCELMAESVVGRYTTIWDDTGFYVYGLGPDGKPL